MTQVILIDGKNFVYRMHAVHKNLSSQGFPTSVLYGCPTAMLSLAKKFPGAALVFIWDGQGPTWRHRLLSEGHVKSHPTVKNTMAESVRVKGSLPAYMQMSIDYIKKTTPHVARPTKTKATPVVGYKANRVGMQDNWLDAAKQMPLFHEFLDKIGIRQFEIANFEGDDLMGVMATWISKDNIFDEVIIHSSDRDFYQFISERVKVLRGGKEGGFASKEDIFAEFGVQCEDYTKLRAVIGDPGDNIPHLFDGVGPKTAVKWLTAGLDPSCERFNDLPSQAREELQRIDKYDIRHRWKEIHTNYIVSQIVRGVEHPYLSAEVKQALTQLQPKISKGFLLSDMRKRNPDTWRWMTDYCSKYELNSLYESRQAIWQLP